MRILQSLQEQQKSLQNGRLDPSCVRPKVWIFAVGGYTISNIWGKYTRKSLCVSIFFQRKIYQHSSKTGWQTEKMTQTFVCQSFPASLGEFLPNKLAGEENKNRPRHPKSSKYLVRIRFVTLRNLSSHEMSWGLLSLTRILTFGMTGCLGRNRQFIEQPSSWLSALNPDYFSLRML